MGDDEICYFEPGGGYVRPEVCIASQLKLAAGPKTTVVTGSRVISVRQEGDHVVVTTGDGEYRAAKAIVSAGAGAAKLLGAPFDTLLNPVRQAMHWYAPDPAYADAWANGPTYIWMRGNFIYGFPDIDGSGVKAADEFAGPGIDPDTLDTRVPEADSAAHVPREHRRPLQRRAAAAPQRDGLPLHADARPPLHHRRTSGRRPHPRRLTVLGPRLQALRRNRRSGGAPGDGRTGCD